MANKSRSKDYTVDVNLRVDSVLYTGQLKGNVKLEKFERTVKAGTAQNIAMPVTYQEYAGEMSDQCAFSISCLATVKETEFEFFSQDDFRVRKPDITVKVLVDAQISQMPRLRTSFSCSRQAPKEVLLGEQFDVTVSLRNPLPTSLNRARFVVEGAGLGVPHKVVIPKPVAVGQDASVTVKMTAAKAGQKTIAAKFYSNELNDVDGYLIIDIVENEA